MERLLRSVVTRWFRPITALPIKRLIRSATRAVGLLLVMQPVSAGLRLIPRTGNFSLPPHRAFLNQQTDRSLGILSASPALPAGWEISPRSRSTPAGTFGKPGPVAVERCLPIPLIAVLPGIRQFKL